MTGVGEGVKKCLIINIKKQWGGTAVNENGVEETSKKGSGSLNTIELE